MVDPAVIMSMTHRRTEKQKGRWRSQSYLSIWDWSVWTTIHTVWNVLVYTVYQLPRLILPSSKYPILCAKDITPKGYILNPNRGLWWLPRWFSSKEPTCLCRRYIFDTWVGKIPWRRKWQPTAVFLPGKSHGKRRLADYSPWGYKELDTTEAT